ncbi:MAG TPA: STAS domain-containing protein [Acidimicrobiia bacterium]|nr:STAS domain-containing protein [Acidimicrobiia bacterium]
MYGQGRSRDRALDPGFFAHEKGKAMQVTYQALTEIDIATAPAFREAMFEMIDWTDEPAVVIDCSAITFMDSSAFHALKDANRHAIEHGHVLVLRGLRTNCLRLVRICDRRNEIAIES